MPDIHPQIDLLLNLLDDMQASEVTVLDVQSQTTITDFMIICSGRSSRHVKAIAEHVMEQMKAKNRPALSHTGIDVGDWALIDFGDVVLHVMQPDSRAFYNLEALWQPTS